MMLGDRLDQLRRIPLPAVLRETGAQRDRSDKAKWHTPVGAISITGMKFMNWHQSRGGGGAIDLAMHLNDLDFKRAVAWLQGHFSIPPDFEPPQAPRHLALPLPNPSRLSAVKHYLVHELHAVDGDVSLESVPLGLVRAVALGADFPQHGW